MRVVTRDGADPTIAYAARVPRHGGTSHHRNALANLLAAGSVTVSDSEISALVDDASVITILIRYPTDRFRTRMIVRPMTTAEHVTHCPGEVRDVPPTIDDWRRVVTNGIRWELYSCVIEGLFSDRIS